MPDPTRDLSIYRTTKPPMDFDINYTDANRPTPAAVPAGTVIFNTSDNALNVSDGTNWKGPGAAAHWETT